MARVSQKAGSKDKQLEGMVEDMLSDDGTFDNRDSDGEEESGSETGAESDSDTDGEAYPPQYYLTHVDSVNQSDVVEVDYDDSTTDQLDRVERAWHQYVVPSHPSGSLQMACLWQNSTAVVPS